MSERLLAYLLPDRSVAFSARWGASSMGIAEAVSAVARAMEKACMRENAHENALEIRRLVTEEPDSPYRAVECPDERDFQMIAMIDITGKGFIPSGLMDTMGTDDADEDDAVLGPAPSWIYRILPWNDCRNLPDKLERLCTGFFTDPDADNLLLYVSGV